MEKTTTPEAGYWWTKFDETEEWEIVEVCQDVDEPTGGDMMRIGHDVFFPIDGEREFWGPIPEFVPPQCAIP